ncbi:hypothetical protein AB6846_24565 [Serratia proteamaculans]
MDLREGTNRLKVAYTDISGTLNYIRQDSAVRTCQQQPRSACVLPGMPNNGASGIRARACRATPPIYAPGTKTRDYSYLGSDTVLQ